MASLSFFIILPNPPAAAPAAAPPILLPFLSDPPPRLSSFAASSPPFVTRPLGSRTVRASRKSSPDLQASHASSVKRELPREGDKLPFNLPGSEPDFWEGPQWNALGFVVEYLWAFGIAIALIGAGVAAATYNIGATDIKQTALYKESIESQFQDTTDTQGLEEFVPQDAPPLQESPS